MVPIGKCYYCGGYFELAEMGDWEICGPCEAREEIEYSWMEEEREYYVLGDIDDYDLPHISVKLAWEDDEE